MTEIWKPINGHEGYEISNHGRVRSYWRKGPNPSLLSTPKIKALIKGVRPSICLWRNGKGTILRISKIVFEHFIRPLKANEIIDHIDCNPSNNLFTNLRATNDFGNNRHRSKVIGLSKYKGVSKLNKGWRAQINRKCIGIFESELQAAIKYDLKAIELFGDFSRTNLITTADRLGSLVK